MSLPCLVASGCRGDAQGGDKKSDRPGCQPVESVDDGKSLAIALEYLATPPYPAAHPSPGPGHTIRRYPLPQVVDGHHGPIFEPHFGRLPAGLVGGGDEGQVAVGFVVFLKDVNDGLFCPVVRLGPGEGGLVNGSRRFVHNIVDCSRALDIVPLVEDEG